MKILLIVCFGWMLSLYAVDVEMEIIKGISKPQTLGIVLSSESTKDKIANDIMQVIKKDLEVSCNFLFEDKNFSTPISINNYKQAMFNDLGLFVNVQSSNTILEIDFVLYDFKQNKMILQNRLSTTKSDRYIFLAHKLAIVVNDTLYPNATISWMDRLVLFSRNISPRESEILVGDYTLSYQKVLIKGGINLFPKWANRNQDSFYYTSLSGMPTLYKFNIISRKQDKILSSDGMAVCSDVSDDGKLLLVSMAPNTQSDIYLFDTQANLKTRLTNYQGIDVGGQFIDNDTKMVFISDRLEQPALFVQAISKDNKALASKLPNTSKNSSSFTTYKEYVAYSSKEKGDRDLNIYFVSTLGYDKKQLTFNGRNQFPKFSPDGNVLFYLRSYNGKNMTAIYKMGYNKHFYFPNNTGTLQSIDW